MLIPRWGSRLVGVAIALLICAPVSSCAQRKPSPTTADSPPTVDAAPAAADWQVIGSSVQGRPLRALTVGHGPRRVLFIGGIHGDEPEGAYTTAELPKAFDTANIGRSVTLTILEDANPDGRAAFTRGNANGVDINRNFPASNFDASEQPNGGTPLSQPESRLVFDLSERFDPALVIVLHSWVGKQFINFDGPTRPVAERFSIESGMPLTPSSGFAPTPGSLGSYLGRDRGMQVLTIELLKGSDPKADWERIRPALLNAIVG